jgi:hypothetical protein
MEAGLSRPAGNKTTPDPAPAGEMGDGPLFRILTERHAIILKVPRFFP